MSSLLEAGLAKLLERGLDYRQLHFGIDWNFIHMLQHFQAIRDMGVKYESTQFDIVRFSTASESRPGLRHQVWIQMAELRDVIDDPNYKMYDKVRLAMTSGLRVHCTCEAFKFFGYQYIMTQLDTALAPENRPPNIRNPRHRGTVCKHIAAVLKVFPFWIATVAGELKRQGFDNYQAPVVSAPTREPVQPQEPVTAAPAVSPGAVAEPALTQVTAPRRRRPGESLEGASFWGLVEAATAASA